MMTGFATLVVVLSILAASSAISANIVSTTDKPTPAVDYDIIVKLAARVDLLETRDLQHRHEMAEMQDVLKTRELQHQQQMDSVQAQLTRQGREILSLRHLVTNANKKTPNDQGDADLNSDVEKAAGTVPTQTTTKRFTKESGNRETRNIHSGIENTLDDVTVSATDESVPAEHENKGVNSRIRRQEVETRVAFYATVSNNTFHLGKNQNVEFDYVVTNEGNGYIPHAGLFVAPVDGTYVFSTTITTIERDISDFGFALNDKFITSIYVNGNEKWYDSSAQTIVLQLQKGEDVSVKHINSDHSVAGGSHSTFSGFLLYQSRSGVSVVG